MGGGSINGRTKFDALLVAQIRLREMSLVGMRQGNAEAEVAAGGRLARDQNKGLMNSCGGARRHYETSYIVTACPQYEVG